MDVGLCQMLFLHQGSFESSMCFRMRLCAPQNSCVANLMPKVMLLGGGAFKRQLGHEGAAFKGGISVFIKEAPEGFLSSFSVEGHNRESVTWKRPPHSSVLSS